ncbi:hypothetical protein CB1_000495004 [Camelus ferus]|nr:hypothetical protein CB1_000495004 [Camelus ferus]
MPSLTLPDEDNQQPEIISNSLKPTGYQNDIPGSANEADECLDFKKVQYEGRKASFVTRNSTLNGNSYYEARASKGEQLGRVSQASDNIQTYSSFH